MRSDDLAVCYSFNLVILIVAVVVVVAAAGRKKTFIDVDSFG